MSTFSEEIIDYINSNNMIGIKAGHERPSFLEIWMVAVNNRVFARSWGFAEKSWYNTFRTTTDGLIKCGNTVIPIKAVIPADLKSLHESINKAYLEKYNHGDNSYYATGIIKKEHAARTMEFIPAS